MRRWLFGWSFLACFAAGIVAASAQSAPATLAEVRARGELLCGVSGDNIGFSAPDQSGTMRGMDADLCRAIAAAALGDAGHVRFIPFPTTAAGLTALVARQIDVLARYNDITLQRDAMSGVRYAGIWFYDGQGLLLRATNPATDLAEMNNATVCVGSASSATAVRDAAVSRGLTLRIEEREGAAGAASLFRAGGCDAISTGRTLLAGLAVTSLSDIPTTLLRTIITRDPIGPFVRTDDDAWRAIVTWTIQLLTNAEEEGVTSQNLVQSMQNPNPVVRRMIGLEPGNGAVLGLPEDWGLSVLSTVGNYAEIFDRSLGRASVLQLDRGLNDLWLNGGLIYPLPLR